VGAAAVREAGETSMILSLPMWWVYGSLAPGLALSAAIALYQAAMLFLRRPLTALRGEH
jgi:TRAP-type C4-dicarboxylate transport system permease small subunit